MSVLNKRITYLLTVFPSSYSITNIVIKLQTQKKNTKNDFKISGELFNF